jgi:hypothetical protein
MDNAILKKRLSTFRSEKGTITKVHDELLVDILTAWESWTGTAKNFHVGLGLSKTQLGGLMGKAKKLRREGKFPENEFKEIKVEPAEGGSGFSGAPCGIELCWDAGKVIRFSQVEQLVDFLKKVA